MQAKVQGSQCAIVRREKSVQYIFIFALLNDFYKLRERKEIILEVLGLILGKLKKKKKKNVKKNF